MPPLEKRDPAKLRAASIVLRAIIDDFQPTAIVMPAFEGGHVHHDMVAALVDLLVTPADRFAVFEAPEYSPCVSLLHTPHRVLALCARWLFGLVAYNGPPDGVDGRPILKLRMAPSELADKRRMLGAFASQNAPSLMATRSYPDRLIARVGHRQHSAPSTSTVPISVSCWRCAGDFPRASSTGCFRYSSARSAAWARSPTGIPNGAGHERLRLGSHPRHLRVA